MEKTAVWRGGRISERNISSDYARWSYLPEIGVAATHYTDGWRQFVEYLIFQHVARCARGSHGRHEVTISVHRKPEHFHVRICFADLASCLDATLFGYNDIHDYDIRPEFSDQPNGCYAIARLAQYHQVGLRIQQGANRRTKRRIVVH